MKVACFAKPFAVLRGRCSSRDEPILVTRQGEGRAAAATSDRDGEPPPTKELNMQEAVPLAQLRAEKTKQMMVELPADLAHRRADRRAQGRAREVSRAR